jgi:hypothetical protein
MVFVHTPKCSGSFVAKAFGARFRWCPTLRWREMQGHLTWQEYNQRFAARGIDFRRAFLSFSVVRNPWAWHVSWFTYIRADKDGRKSGHKIEYDLFSRFTFRDYLDWLEDPDALRGHQGYMQRQIQDWLIDCKGDLAVDHVLRTETISEDLVSLRDHYNLRIDIPVSRVNVSNKRDYRSFYRSKDVEQIARRHASDIDRFGYKFDT